MKRRAFLASLLALPAAAKAAVMPNRVPRSLVRLAKANDAKTGISMRFVKQFDIVSDAAPARMDWIIIAKDPITGVDINGLTGESLQ